MKGKALIRVAALVIVATFLSSSAVHAQQFKLSSPDIKPNASIAEEQVFNGFGCSGKNISPALQWFRCAERREGLRAAGARSGRADGRRRMVALACD